MGPDDAVSFRAGQFWNDRASSARVARGCTLVIYERTRVQGDSAEIHRRARNLGDGWNDRMSSAECFCDSYDDDYRAQARPGVAERLVRIRTSRRR